MEERNQKKMHEINNELVKIKAAFKLLLEPEDLSPIEVAQFIKEGRAALLNLDAEWSQLVEKFV